MFLGSVPASISDIVRVCVRVSVCGHLIFLCLNDQAYNCLIHFYKRGPIMCRKKKIKKIVKEIQTEP